MGIRIEMHHPEHIVIREAAKPFTAVLSFTDFPEDNESDMPRVHDVYLDRTDAQTVVLELARQLGWTLAVPAPNREA